MRALALIMSVLMLIISPSGKVNIKGYRETPDEKKIYSYVQVPKDYYADERWIGDWTDIESGGQKFFYFGCGVCCLSNMISTLTPKVIAPDAMFELAKKQTDYNPDSGRGSLSWKQLRSICEQAGLSAEVKRKPDDIDVFRRDVENSDTTLVLVCKDNDDKLWFYTNGHYVNLWKYDPETDTVFVTDASGMFNRDRVQLEDIYNALKTRSDAQYMTVKVQ